ncbi:MAG: glutamate-1-semialdehyde 2,1-aminomutase [Oscillospiraceae bacterium]|nr:glutamate-1-semialdehyde 2,1-aminomutase [Oscillospiraceae bacterium]
MNTQKSEALYERAQQFMPGGVNSPVRAFRSVGRAPLFIERAAGSRIYDADSNVFLDYVCSWGPGILGHAHPAVLEAVQRACEKGLTFGACHAGEIELAELIQEQMPSMEMLRMVSSGTEAAMSAVRAARGFTHRDRIIKFEGCYHGHSDGLLVRGGSGLLTHAIPDSAGVPAGCTENTLLAVYNDADSVRALFDAYRGEIAAVIVEPCAANMGVVPPAAGFLEALRQITKEHGALLIFDEVITGFRLSPGGAQQYYGITPDLTALGKIVGGGMPLAVYGGRREIMECVAPLGSVYQAGTLSGNPAAVAAGTATLRELGAHPEIYALLEQKSARLQEAAESAGLRVNRCGSLMTVFFTDAPVTDFAAAKAADTGAYARFFNYLLENGIYTAPSQFEAMFVSAAHSDADIDRTCEVLRQYTRCATT